MTLHPCRCCGRDSSPLRWACPACVRDTWRRLDELQDHAVVITAALVPGRGRLDGLPRASGYGSRPPTSLDLLTALDYRSHVDGQGVDDDPHETTLSILGSLHQVARYVRHQLRQAGQANWLPPTQVTITGEARFLRVHAEWCAHQTWGHEFVATVRQVHAQARRQASDAPPTRLGLCQHPDCPGSVWPASDGNGGRCGIDPRHTYTGLALARLHRTRHDAAQVLQEAIVTTAKRLKIGAPTTPEQAAELSAALRRLADLVDLRQPVAGTLETDHTEGEQVANDDTGMTGVTGVRLSRVAVELRW